MYDIHPPGAGRGTHHVGEGHEELRNHSQNEFSSYAIGLCGGQTANE